MIYMFRYRLMMSQVEPAVQDGDGKDSAMEPPPVSKDKPQHVT